MNKLNFDSPKTVEMQNFLNRLYIIGTQNPNLYLSKDIIYREMCRAGLKSSNIAENGELLSNEVFFDKWINRNNDPNNDLHVFVDIDWDYFIQFISDSSYDYLINKNRFIKLYIPIDIDHLYEYTNELFDFIKKSGIKHISKISKKMRSDNLIIRLEDTDIDSASRIIEFVNSNFDTNNSLNKTNPFIPTINGVGYMVESGISYNTEISKLLEQFINIYIRANTCPSIQNFYDWFKQNNSSIEINNIFENSLGIQKQTSVSQKKAIFFDTLKATYTKHGIKQTEYALEQVIYNNNYKGFSNGNSNIRYRDLLMQTITPDEIKNFIKEALENDIDINKNDINKFCFKLFENDLVFKLNDACNVTLNNYNIEQLISAIAKLLYENNPGMFSRFSKNKNDKTNYREIISQYDKNNILMSIVKHLSLKGISYDLENTDELIRTYALDIMNSQYTYMDNITKANK